jgi:hypothetical protein
MSLLQNITHLLSSKKPKMDCAYYLCTTGANIKLTGVALSTDGFIHLFGNLSCAFEKRDCLERKGTKTSIWKVDISCCGKAEIDPSEEELSNRVPGEHNDICHGFLITKPIQAGAIIGIIDFI